MTKCCCQSVSITSQQRPKDFFATLLQNKPARCDAAFVMGMRAGVGAPAVLI
jgi:hypothetical protein